MAKFWNHCGRESGPAPSLPHPKYVHRKTVRTLGLLSVFPGLLAQAHIPPEHGPGSLLQLVKSSRRSTCSWHLAHPGVHPDQPHSRVPSLRRLLCVPTASLYDLGHLRKVSNEDFPFMSSFCPSVFPHLPSHPFPATLPPSSMSCWPTLRGSVLDAGAMNRRHRPCPLGSKRDK